MVSFDILGGDGVLLHGVDGAAPESQGDRARVDPEQIQCGAIQETEPDRLDREYIAGPVSSSFAN